MVVIQEVHGRKTVCDPHTRIHGFTTKLVVDLETLARHLPSPSHASRQRTW